MNYLIEQCLFPIIDGDECVGQGFVADGFFITAAHIIKRWPNCFVEIGGQRILLSGTKALYVGDGDVEKDSKKGDVAIYAFNGVRSFLHLSTRKVIKTDNLRSYCLFSYYDNTTGLYHNELYAVPVILQDLEEGNYIYGRCNRYQGSSGSPLVIGTDVVGIMHGGDDNELCAFLRPVKFMLPEFVPYDSKIFKDLAKFSNPFPREEPWTPEYFNNKAREQVGDAFE